MVNLVSTDFNRQGIDALNTGMGIGNQIQRTKQIGIDRERQAQQDRQQSQLFGQKSQINDQTIQMNQGNIEKQERASAMGEMITALNLPFDKRNELFAELEATKQTAGAKKALSHLQTLSNEDQLTTMLQMIDSQTGGQEKKLSSLQLKVEAEGIDPLSPQGQARAREITQGSRTDPSLKPSDQQTLNKANEGQLASSTFANRVFSANKVLTDLENTKGFDPTSLQTAFFETVPGGNLALSEQEQQFSQAKRDFITAVLRKESGAAIGKDEFTNEDKKFFPQVGDKPAVLKQKAKGRERAFQNLKAQSKGVYDVQFGEKSGKLSKAEQAELQQLRAELGGK